MSRQGGSYEDWLVKQKELAKEAYEFIKSFGLDVKVIEKEGKRSFLRIIVSSTQSLFFDVKEVKSRFAREIWVCKVQDTFENTGFLLYAAKEDSWLIITNRDIQSRGAKRPSSYPSGGEYYVVPREYFRGAVTFFRQMKKTIEERKQKRLGEYF